MLWPGATNRWWNNHFCFFYFVNLMNRFQAILLQHLQLPFAVLWEVDRLLRDGQIVPPGWPFFSVLVPKHMLLFLTHVWNPMRHVWGPCCHQPHASTSPAWCSMKYEGEQRLLERKPVISCGVDACYIFIKNNTSWKPERGWTERGSNIP